MENTGIHVIDVCAGPWDRPGRPLRDAFSIAGRLGFHDCGETATPTLALLDFQPAPPHLQGPQRERGQGAAAIGKFRGQNKGV